VLPHLDQVIRVQQAVQDMIIYRCWSRLGHSRRSLLNCTYHDFYSVRLHDVTDLDFMDHQVHGPQVKQWSAAALDLSYHDKSHDTVANIVHSRVAAADTSCVADNCKNEPWAGKI
jgi:hypothetical protein